MKKYLLKFAFWLLKKYKVNYMILPLQENQQFIVASLVDQVNTTYPNQPSEFKRSHTLRAVMNSFPELSKRDASFSIELEIQKKNLNV